MSDYLCGIHHLSVSVYSNDCSTVLFIAGEQVKQLLMKSGLPMPVLGHIWYAMNYAMHHVIIRYKCSFVIS